LKRGNAPAIYKEAIHWGRWPGRCP